MLLKKHDAIADYPLARFEGIIGYNARKAKGHNMDGYCDCDDLMQVGRMAYSNQQSPGAEAAVLTPLLGVRALTKLFSSSRVNDTTT